MCYSVVKYSRRVILMRVSKYNLKHLSNQQLLDGLGRVNQQAHKVTAELLAHLAEVDTRKIYLEQACSSLFSYCIERLGATEDETARRIHAARLARRFPIIFELVANGELFLSSINLLAPYLPQDVNFIFAHELIKQACGKTKRQVEQLLAARFPKADVASTLRKLPVKTQAPLLANTAAANTVNIISSSPNSTEIKTAINEQLNINQDHAPAPISTSAVSPSSPAVLAPLSASRFKLQTTLSEKGREKLLRAKELLRHKLPKAQLGDVIEFALEHLCQQLEAKKFAKLKRTKRLPKQHVEQKQTAKKVAKQINSGIKDNKQYGPGHTEKGFAKKNSKQTSRYLPRQLRRIVAERDGYQCTFKSHDGRRCTETAGLEYHHIIPYAQGGLTSLDNIQLRCRQHNLHQATIDFGVAKIQQAIAHEKSLKMRSITKPVQKLD